MTLKNDFSGREDFSGTVEIWSGFKRGLKKEEVVTRKHNSFK